MHHPHFTLFLNPQLAIEGTIEFDEGLNELVQYIRSPADRGARILAAQAVFKLTRAKLNATELVGDVSARVGC